MNSPYNGKFRVSQIQHANHDGLDLVGIDSKEIHATISGIVVYAGWENPANHSQGFGQYVCIRGTDNRYYYFPKHRRGQDAIATNHGFRH